MSLLRSSRLFTQRIAVTARPARCQLAPAFSTSSFRFAGKEGAVHENAADRAAEAEHHKQDQLKSAQETGQGKKKNELASDSEEALAAENGEHKDKGPEQLMKDTEDDAQKKHGQ